MITIPQRYRRSDGRTDNSWARTRGAQLSTGYTVNTYSISRCALYSWVPRVRSSSKSMTQQLFIGRKDRHATRLTNRTASQSDSTQLKAGNSWARTRVAKLSAGYTVNMYRISCCALWRLLQTKSSAIAGRPCDAKACQG